MVEKATKYIALLLVGLTGLCFVGTASLIGTETGSRWLLSQLKGLTTVKIEFSSFEGRLADRIVIHDLKVKWQSGTLDIEELTLVWSPGKLLFRQLDIDELGLKTPAYRSLDAAAEPQSRDLPSWPELTDVLQRWQVDIAKLSLTQASYISSDAEPLVFDNEVLNVHLAKGILVLDEFQAKHLDYISRGTLKLNLAKPSLEGEISLSSAKTPDELELLFKLQNSSEALLQGSLSARIAATGWPEHLLNSNASLYKDKLSLADLKIRQKDIQGSLEGKIDLSWRDEPAINASLDLAQWPLQLPQETIVLDGAITAAGPLDKLLGQYNLTATGTKFLSGSLAGEWQITEEQARVNVHSGAWLGSQLSGVIQTTLPEPDTARFEMRLRGLDPAHIDNKWKGRVNLDATAVVSQPDDKALVEFDAQFIDSQLRGFPLNGVARGSWHDDILTIARADLSGVGFRLAADGSLDRRLNLDFKISDLGGILPDSQGQLNGRGWVGLRDSSWIGNLTASGQALQYENLSTDSVSFSLARDEQNLPADINLEMQTIKYGAISVHGIDARLTGDVDNHELSVSITFSQGSARSTVTGELKDADWLGTINSFDIQHDEFGDWSLESPAHGKVDKTGYSLDTFKLIGSNGNLALTGNMDRNGVPQRLDLHVTRIPLPLISSVLAPLSLAGELDMALQCDELSCHVETSGIESVSFEDRKVTFDSAWLKGDWGQKGLHAELEVELPDNANFTGYLFSNAPLQNKEPFPLEWKFKWHSLPLFAIKDQPVHLDLSGTWQGYSKGVLLNQSAFHGELQASLDNVVLTWTDEDSVPVQFNVDEASLESSWKNDALFGSMELNLGEHGQVSSSWHLPIPARWPVEPARGAKVSGHLGGWFKENGLIGILWPDIVQDTQGDIEIETYLEGTWGQPQIRGESFLRNGHAYIPVAGITLDAIDMSAEFNDDRIVLKSLTAESSPGKLTAAGQIDLKAWAPKTVNLAIQGQDFTLIDLPELRARVNPDLALSGTKADMRLSGGINIPYFLATGRSERSPVQRSPDVVIVGDEPKVTDNELPFNLKTNIKLTLGEQVLVDMFGLNARLGGQLELTDIDKKHFTGAGLIEVLEGTYSTYGVKLRIDKGRATYAHGPLDNPAIDILALRDIGETKAGVQVRGTAKVPQVKLYSEPTLPDTDILSLIVLGRPLDQAGGETDPLMLAAGALLSAGDSVVLKNQLQNKLGIDSIAAESEGGQTNDTILRLGKYLTPDLYLSYGYALFGQRSEVGLRYKIYKGWEAESNFGLESGADLFYRFEFD